MDECPGPQMNCFEAPTANETTAGTAVSRKGEVIPHLSLLRCLSSTKITSADLVYRYPGLGPRVALQTSDGLIAKPWKNTHPSPTSLPSCAWPDHGSTVWVRPTEQNQHPKSSKGDTTEACRASRSLSPLRSSPFPHCIVATETL